MKSRSLYYKDLSDLVSQTLVKYFTNSIRFLSYPAQCILET